MLTIKTRPKQSSSQNTFKFLLLIFNIIFLFLALGALAIGIWLVVDRIFISNVIGSHFLTVAAYILLIGGAISLIVCMIGILAATTHNRIFTLVYLGLLIFILVVLLLAAILAIVFKQEIGEHTKRKMYESLVTEYGVDQHNQWNRDVTWAWDQAQERLQCCGIEFEERAGYTQYQYSQWYKNLPDLDQKIKPMVPMSCCKRDPVTLQILGSGCQTFQTGPPKTTGGSNAALHMLDCYNRGLWYINDHTAVIIGVGIGISVIMIGGIILALLFFRSLK